MKNLIKVLLSLSFLWLAACEKGKVAKLSNAEDGDQRRYFRGKERRGECHFVGSKKPVDRAYSLNFNESYKLYPVPDKKTFYVQVQAGREFGCVMFGAPWTAGKLEGYFKAVEVEHLVSICEGTKDYIYTQFYDRKGKKMFRLQCDHPVYEDQLPQPFSPTYEQVKKIRFNGNEKSTVTVREED